MIHTFMQNKQIRWDRHKVSLKFVNFTSETGQRLPLKKRFYVLHLVLQI